MLRQEVALGALLSLGACSKDAKTLGVADFPAGHPGEVAVSKCGHVTE